VASQDPNRYALHYSRLHSEDNGFVEFVVQILFKYMIQSMQQMENSNEYCTPCVPRAKFHTVALACFRLRTHGLCR
jgi:hypothetical protein